MSHQWRILLDEIFTITLKIQVKFPELYQVLSETPLFQTEAESNMLDADFEHYLESLKYQMKDFETNSATHHQSKKHLL
ncbi:MAG TPA: hypothetical protein VK168_13680 [Saprospiraceae bacterium]|nr:hypothetical protein [Saprospiraceae bacterium]